MRGDERRGLPRYSQNCAFSTSALSGWRFDRLGSLCPCLSSFSAALQLASDTCQFGDMVVRRKTELNELRSKTANRGASDDRSSYPPTVVEPPRFSEEQRRRGGRGLGGLHVALTGSLNRLRASAS